MAPSTTNTALSAANIGVYTNPSHDLYVAPASPSLDEVRDGSSLQPGEVTIAIKSTGICGSDVHFWRHGGVGHWQVTGPHILGHESAGQVVALHPTVTTLSIGDRVAVEPQVVCRACEACLTGRYTHCRDLVFPSSPPYHGLLRTYVNHPAMWCHRLPDALSFDDGALLEPLSVALTGVTRAAVKIGDPVLVCGAGPIGLVVLEVCRAAGACPLVIADVNEERLRFAEALVPAVRTLKVELGGGEEAFAAKVAELMGGVEPAIALECTGVQSSICGAIQSVKFGGNVWVIGVGKDRIEIPFMRLSAREIELHFQQRYVNMWPRAIRVLESGVVDLKRLITHEFRLENAVEAFETAGNPKSGSIKVVIRSGGDVEC
ncbi:putative sorbitol dehydrogenase protein [Neofusicoccum parvum]|nr:putative sorbitol dehydrogenase protein [Neofusicoccum parvum]